MRREKNTLSRLGLAAIGSLLCLAGWTPGRADAQSCSSALQLRDDQFTFSTTPRVYEPLANDSAGGLALRITGVSAVQGGSATVTANGQGVRFEPGAGQSGGGFVYTARDSSGRSGSASVSLLASISLPGDGRTLDFTSTCAGVNCTFVAQPSSSAGIRAYRWDFGDGTPAVVFSTAFHVFAQTGAKNVRLQAFYHDGAELSKSKVVNVQLLPANIAWSIQLPAYKNMVARVDWQTNTFKDRPGTRQYFLVWGDGSPNLNFDAELVFSDLRFTHTYSQVGLFRPGVKVRETVDGVTQEFFFPKDVQILNGTPQPEIAVTVSPNPQSYTVRFDASATVDDGPIASMVWDFADGTRETQNAPPFVIEHDYFTNGTKVVVLKVTDLEGSEAVISKPVELANRPPTAVLRPQCVGLDCVLDSAANDDEALELLGAAIVRHTWDFGDGETYTSEDFEDPPHTFQQRGCYRATYTAEDRWGAKTTVTALLALDAEPLLPGGGLVVDGIGTLPSDAVAGAVDGGAGLLNGFLEPREYSQITPVVTNLGESADLQGLVLGWSGPGDPGLYDLAFQERQAFFGFVESGETADCSRTGDCYQLATRPQFPRPAAHWDTSLTHTVAGNLVRNAIHIGGSFADVPPAHWAYRFVESAFHHGMTSGCGNGNFCPDTLLTRGTMAVFLIRALEEPGYQPPACTTPPFADVPCSSPFAPYVQQLKDRQLTNGCGNGNFCPNEVVGRRAMAYFIAHALHGPGWTPPPCLTPIYQDVACSDPYAAEIAVITALGISNGCGSNNFCPTQPVSRATAAVLLGRAFELDAFAPTVCQP